MRIFDVTVQPDSWHPQKQNATDGRGKDKFLEPLILGSKKADDYQERIRCKYNYKTGECITEI